MPHMQWRKSSYSGDVDGNACVELAQTPDAAILLWESDDPRTVITTTPAALRAFTRSVRAGRLDHLFR